MSERELEDKTKERTQEEEEVSNLEDDIRTLKGRLKTSTKKGGKGETEYKKEHTQKMESEGTMEHKKRRTRMARLAEVIRMLGEEHDNIRKQDPEQTLVEKIKGGG